ncbi:CubicO group peptidase (beta-lactamase class C family) [Winogradskyella wandonensis]|uniref:CubicO group peptidase (Beta-lactamase class C family) n=1 Tax=Winogradskyella wandonensis TaxID=1442586 RepID=A0A4R1KW67_9FLAO|nr:serine hydrolase domain-containing protein [Winogradskyella wandonensis]TCK69404.1 CubicO group peptidase (beta-lactamase class C family) [Winogradskyella wandonensis]
MNKIHILTLLLSFATINIVAQEQFNPEQQLKELSGKKQNIGIAAAYSIDGVTEWSQSSGFSCQDSEIPFSSTTLTRIASIAKPMTAVAIMQLFEKGLIELDTPIQTYLPTFPRKEKGDITIKQLLTHTSGISQYQSNKEVENKTQFNSLQEAIDVFRDRPLLFKPGSEYFYTSYGYVLLGRIIEQVSGLSYEDYMQKNIFDIANMKNTGIENINKQYDNKSCLYHNQKRKTKKTKQNNLSNRIPAGGFYSTLDDVIKFGEAIVNNTLISESTFKLMLESQPVTYDGSLYGFGWFFYGPKPNENIVIGHEGGQSGCTSQLFIIPKSKTVVVVLSNTSGTYRDVVTFASKLISHSELNKK